MQIECEKGYVSFLVGMSMRSAIWKRFGLKMHPKSVPKCSKIGPKADAKGICKRELQKRVAEFIDGAARELTQS